MAIDGKAIDELASRLLKEKPDLEVCLKLSELINLTNAVISLQASVASSISSQMSPNDHKEHIEEISSAIKKLEDSFDYVAKFQIKVYQRVLDAKE